MLMLRPKRLLAIGQTLARRLVARPRDAAKLPNQLLACLVVMALSYACVASAVSMARGTNSFPELTTWRKFPAKFEKFLNDHLPARPAMLNVYAHACVEGFGVSPTPRVWLGRDGMLFFNVTPELPAEQVGPEAEAAAVEYWGQLMRRRRDWCADRGIEFLLVIAPDKQSVCQNQLPRATAHKSNPTILDRVRAEWDRQPAIRFVDLRGPLREAVATTTVYLRYDTHWTPYGKWLAYRRTMDFMPEACGSPREWDDLPKSEGVNDGFDLWRLMGFAARAPREAFPWPTVPNTAKRCELQTIPLNENDRLNHLKPCVWEDPSSHGPRVVLTADSFAEGLYQELLATHCSRLVVVPTYEMPEEFIERERPDIVICEGVERKMQNVRPRMPGEQ